jgi:sec-independent protein translocase protein TatA
MPGFGPTELIIVLLIVIVLFGAGRIGKIGAELGQSVREFRKGLSAGDQAVKAPQDEEK